ncbi:MAG: hypothetical protein NTY09_04665 [bacterium]|nr:hypothetical protein [bacterium]
MMRSGILHIEKPAAIAFWGTLLGSCAIVVAIVAVFNFIVNPYGLYPTNFLPKISSSIFDYKVKLLSEFDPPPEVLILGSSRALCIDPDVVEEITGRRCFNWALWDSKIEIVYASVRIALEEFHDPIDLVIVGVEPEMFHLTNQLHAQARTSTAYTKYFEPKPFYKPIVDKVLRTISYGQLISSLRSIRHAMRGMVSTNESNWRDDGFRMFQEEGAWGINEMEANLDKMIEAGINSYPEVVWKPDEFTDLSEFRKQYWNMFLDYCEEHQIQVYAFLQPVHPALLDKLYEIGGEPLFEKTDEFVRDSVNRIHGVYRDYRNPESFGGDPTAFYDEVHMLPSNGALLVRDLLSGLDSYPGDNAE